MKVIKKVIGFFRSLFGLGECGDCSCGECQEKAVCQTLDRSKKYAVIVGME